MAQSPQHKRYDRNSAERFTITLANLGGQTFQVDGDKTLLNALEEHGVSLPYGCRYGGCISCAAKLLDGDVDQSAGVALNGRQISDGYVLLCVALPRSDCTLNVGVESHDKLYRNPFQSPLRPDELKAGIRAGSQTLEDKP
ncbi:MAG: 2Fe-2S iron-sulfur cluster-binding protein [Pseudomonadota bacterium]|nr:2Fe-2S iron-sulfur cluster-binding protein [Pseudomonadota bacterium]